MAMNTRFSVTPATDLDNIQNSSKQDKREEISMESPISRNISGELQYHPTIVAGLYQPVITKLVHSDSIVEKAHEVMATPSFDMKAMTSRYNKHSNKVNIQN